jgi:ABC-type multidrug transport system fused ATPase/permease subunit
MRTSAFDEVLRTLPQGLDTPINERGFNLSGGQRQRLCLARGVLAARDSSLLLLDEPTSALDPLTEARVHDMLDGAFPDACIVASVHRMALLSHFDRVVLMAGGRIVDSGTVRELVARQPMFRAMANGPASTIETQAAVDGPAPLQTATSGMATASPDATTQPALALV